MPNHVQSKVHFDCSEKQANEILRYVQYDPDPEKEEYTGLGTFDFNKLIPMPEDLNITAGSETDKGLKAYSNFVTSYKMENGISKSKVISIPKEAEDLYREKNTDVSDEAWNLGKAAFRNLEKYDSATWYEWCYKNWNTKWNSYDPWKGEENGLIFSTAWSAPHPVIKELSVRFPGVYITHEWADEDIGHNCGRHEYLNGECVGEYFPETEKEAVEFATGVWGDTPEDYGLELNASETAYLYPSDEKYELIELFGEAALFTSERIDASDIPKGLYVYHVRGDDETTGGFCTLEPRVIVNHFGSIITKDPIEFAPGENECHEFTEYTTPNFIACEPITIDQFRNGDYNINETPKSHQEMNLT